MNCDEGIGEVKMEIGKVKVLMIYCGLMDVRMEICFLINS